MRVSILAAAALAAALLHGSPATAQAPVDLPENARETLASGGRTNVIIMLEEPAVAADVAVMSDQALADRAAGIRDIQEAVVERALGTTLSQLQERRDSFHSTLAEDRPEGAPTLAAPELQRVFRYTPALAMRLDAAQIETLANTPGVARVVENARASVEMDESLLQIGAHLVNQAGYDGAGQAVAIFDTGVDFDHPMTGPAIIGSACFSTSIPDENAWSQCENGQQSAVGGRAGDPCVNCRYPSNHGTHVGGTVAGRPYTVEIDGAERTLQGVAPQAYLVAVNVFHDNVPEGAPITWTSDQIAALEWIIDNPTFPAPGSGDPIPVAAINMSLGGGSNSDFCDADPRSPAIVLLRGMGIATVIASGNSYSNRALAAPGCIGAAVTVGAVTRTDTVADFSNSHFPVDLLAPGVGIRSALMSMGGAPIGAIAYNGTSMATPHVAGTYALLREAFPEATVDQIEYALKTTGRPITDTDNNLTRPLIMVHSAYDYLVRQSEREGPLTIAPTTDYYATVDLNRPEQPDVVTYTITNNSASDVTFSVRVQNNDAITFGGGVRSFDSVVAAGGSFDLNIEIDLAAVYLGQNTGEIQIIANTAGRPQVHRILATVAGYTGPAPTTRPANDNFANAFPITDAHGEYRVSTYGATTQIAEPDHAGGDNGGSVWYVMQAQRPGALNLALQGRQGTNTIAVYRGSSIAALVEVASATAASANAELTFTPTAGDTYYIALDYNPPSNAFGGQEQQQVGFRVVPQAAGYDAFATPYELSAPGGLGLLSFGGATVETGEPFPPQRDNQGTLWMRVNGHEGEQLSLAVLQATTGAAIEMFSGGSLATLELIDQRAFTAFAFGESITVTIPAGGLYVRATPITFDNTPANRAEMLFNWQIGTDSARIATAVAPQVRTTRPHQFVTALAAASAAASGSDATDCGVIGPMGYPGVLRFNALTPEAGDPGDGVDIPAGQSQIYAFGLQRSTVGVDAGAFQGLASTSILVACDNGAGAHESLLNTVHLTLSDTPLPDIIVSTAVTGGAAAELPAAGATRFAAAAANIGVEGDVLVIPVALSDDYPQAIPAAASEALFSILSQWPPAASLPVTLSVCQTDPGAGTCWSDFASHVRVERFEGGQTRTFAVRIQGQGEEIAFAPRMNRVGLVFVQVDYVNGVGDPGSARLLGAATVAVRTTP